MPLFVAELPHSLLQNGDRFVSWTINARFSLRVPLVSKFVLHPRCLVELLGSHGDYLALFSNTQALQVIKTDTNLLINVLRLESCGVHMVVCSVVIKENFMLLILFWQAPYIIRLF